ncbi:MFS transporter [Olivibacter sitiensis]|uniref:MFS transporter n=1 Tax=Olivibacter sitiensis TaxID=376470 RepID=UPI00041BE763|nr:MFS transporter [Olivibacter sitiensis]
MKHLTLFMAVCCGLIVANLYYCQPLLHLIAADFSVSETEAGSITYITQLGYAAGLLLFVPLGDLLEKKTQILYTSCMVVVVLLFASFTRSFFLLQVLSFLIGLFSIIPQLLIPFAASLAKNEERSKVIGLVMGGLLIGIVSSRSLSGLVGQYLGWRYMYFIAASICFLLILLMQRWLPHGEPTFKGTYRELMRSIVTYIKQDSNLRLASLSVGISFGAMCAFWVAMVLFLASPPFSYSTVQIGLFGLVGASGALAAPMIGNRLSSKPQLLHVFVLLALLLELLAYLSFYISTHHILLLVLGIVLLDVGHQMIGITNQSLIYSLNATARNRYNTVFMTSNFIGGALGSALGLALYHWQGWHAVCIGISLTVMGNACLNILWKKR